MQISSITFKSWVWALEDARDSWLSFGIFILTWIWSLVFGTPMLKISALYLDFKGAKNINVLWVLIWGFGGCCRLLSGDWHLDLDLDMITGLWYNYVPNFGSLSWFWRCKEHPCPLSQHLGLWRMLEVPEWVFESWSWFGYGHWSLIHSCSELRLPILILQLQRTYMSFKSLFGASEKAGGSWLEIGILILIWI